MTRSVTPDIVVLREQDQRAVLVRGRHYATAIDLPTDRLTAEQVLTAGRDMAERGLKMAILTHEPEDTDLPLETFGDLRLVRADRKPDQPGEWDRVPQNLLRHPEVPVFLVRQSQRVFDDAGRAFELEPCVGPSTSLAVRIAPEDVLVVCDDLRPDLPPRVQPGMVRETIARLERWRARAPQVLVPASGIPIAGDQMIETLDRSIAYLCALQERTRSGLMESRYPWERLVYTIPYQTLWSGSGASRILAERHRGNLRGMAEDIALRLEHETGAEALRMAA